MKHSGLELRTGLNLPWLKVALVLIDTDLADHEHREQQFKRSICEYMDFEDDNIIRVTDFSDKKFDKDLLMISQLDSHDSDNREYSMGKRILLYVYCLTEWVTSRHGFVDILLANKKNLLNLQKRLEPITSNPVFFSLLHMENDY